MTIVEIDGLQLADAWRGGIYRLLARAEYINRINVFPVADGDTGTNLAMTMSAVLAAIDREPLSHAGTLLTRMADAAIDGARGNSGAIVAQFLLGVGDCAAELPRLSPSDFAAAVQGGATYAREALSEPREGTLLTLMHEFGQELGRAVGAGAVHDFRALLAAVMPALHAALDSTRNQLEELRQAGVVDAGALGLVEIADGMHAWFETGELSDREIAIATRPSPAETMAVGGAHADHRYCTECVITGAAIDQRRLREALSALGSSVVVAGSSRKTRVHIHTDEPEPVFELAGAFGTVSGHKADDIIRQEAAAHHSRARRVAVVTDSAADLSEQALEALDLHVVPVRVHFGSRSFLDRVSLTPAEFYRELETAAEPPRTSQPPPGDFRRMYEFLVSHYESVVSIALSARVSGTCGAARTAAGRIPDQRVRVVDSGNASLGQGLIAMYAAECAAAGWSGEEVAAAAEGMIGRTRTFALLPCLDYAVRGGRVPPVFKTLAQWLRFTVVLASQPGGRISVGGAIFGRRNTRHRFARFVRARMRQGTRYRIAVGHGNSPQEGARLLDEIKEGLANVESITLSEVGTALGAHGGPGLLVVGFQEYETAPRPRLGRQGVPAELIER